MKLFLVSVFSVFGLNMEIYFVNPCIQSKYKKIQTRNNSVFGHFSRNVHHTNIRALAAEIYKFLHGSSPTILNEVFVPSHCKCNYRKNNSLERRTVNTVRYGTDSLSFLGPKIWDIVPDYITSSKTMSDFKNKIKKMDPYVMSL